MSSTVVASFWPEETYPPQAVWPNTQSSAAVRSSSGPGRAGGDREARGQAREIPGKRLDHGICPFGRLLVAVVDRPLLLPHLGQHRAAVDPVELREVGGVIEFLHSLG
jgi:hypothetical protein